MIGFANGSTHPHYSLIFHQLICPSGAGCEFFFRADEFADKARARCAARMRMHVFFDN